MPAAAVRAVRRTRRREGGSIAFGFRRPVRPGRLPCPRPAHRYPRSSVPGLDAARPPAAFHGRVPRAMSVTRPTSVRRAAASGTPVRASRSEPSAAGSCQREVWTARAAGALLGPGASPWRSRALAHAPAVSRGSPRSPTRRGVSPLAWAVLVLFGLVMGWQAFVACQYVYGLVAAAPGRPGEIGAGAPLRGGAGAAPRARPHRRRGGDPRRGRGGGVRRAAGDGALAGARAGAEAAAEPSTSSSSPTPATARSRPWRSTNSPASRPGADRRPGPAADPLPPPHRECRPQGRQHRRVLPQPTAPNTTS